MIHQVRPNPPSRFTMTFIDEIQEEVDKWVYHQKDGPEIPPPKIPKVWAKHNFTDQFKDQLFKTFSGKCIFCERKVDEAVNRRILHYRPYDFDSEPPDNYYFWLHWQWPNIYPACLGCYWEYPKSWQRFMIDGRRPDLANDTLDTLYNVQALFKIESPILVDPCFDNPADHIQFIWNRAGNSVTVKGKTKRGRATVAQLKVSLNDSDLCGERAIEAEALWEEFEKARQEPSGATIGKLGEWCENYQPFAGMKRQFLQQWLRTADRERPDLRKKK